MRETKLKRDSQAQQHPSLGAVCIISALTSLRCCTWSAELQSCLGYYSAVQTTAPLFSPKRPSLSFNSPSSLPFTAMPPATPLSYTFQSFIFLPQTEQPIAPALQPKSCPRNWPEMSQTGHAAMGSWWSRWQVTGKSPVPMDCELKLQPELCKDQGLGELNCPENEKF